MSDLIRLISSIESPTSKAEVRDSALKELNLSGIPNEEIEAAAIDFWNSYFESNMRLILEERIVIVSNLLPDNVINDCFQNRFEEYVQRKKDLGIDDIIKYWGPI